MKDEESEAACNANANEDDANVGCSGRSDVDMSRGDEEEREEGNQEEGPEVACADDKTSDDQEEENDTDAACANDNASDDQ